MTVYEKLLKDHGYVKGLVGKDEDHNWVIVSIDKRSACVTTVQSNKWTRTNIYYPDGTQEELYEH